jgi:hypothetical protein
MRDFIARAWRKYRWEKVSWIQMKPKLLNDYTIWSFFFPPSFPSHTIPTDYYSTRFIHSCAAILNSDSSTSFRLNDFKLLSFHLTRSTFCSSPLSTIIRYDMTNFRNFVIRELFAAMRGERASGLLKWKWWMMNILIRFLFMPFNLKRGD